MKPLALAFLALLSTQLVAQETTLRKPSYSLIFLGAVDAAAKIEDFHYTMRNYDRPAIACSGGVCWSNKQVYESDVLMRPFLGHGHALAATGFATFFAIDAFAAYELHKHRHQRWAHIPLLLGIGQNTYGAASSANGYH